MKCHVEKYKNPMKEDYDNNRYEFCFDTFRNSSIERAKNMCGEDCLKKITGNTWQESKTNIRSKKESEVQS